MKPRQLTQREKQFAEKNIKLNAQAVVKILETHHIPDEKFETVINHVVKTISFNPRMKHERVARKVIEYFKLRKKDAGKNPISTNETAPVADNSGPDRRDPATSDQPTT